jgi:hypothetical protein
MISERPAPPICLVAAWSAESSADGTAVELFRRIADAGLPSTWAVATANQVDSLRKVSGKSKPTIAALGPQGKDAEASDSWMRDVSGVVKSLRATGAAVPLVFVQASPSRGSHERSLHALGIRGLIASGMPTPGARPLPFGLWQLTPRVALPSVRRWTRLFMRAEQPLIDRADTAPTVAAIDVRRLAAAGSRGMREADRAIQQLAQAGRVGAAQAVTAAEMVEQLSSAAAARPQRSILRAA